MVYYTYVTYHSAKDTSLGEYFNWVMVTPDRNTANTYFRLLQANQTVTHSDVNGTPGAKLQFTSVDRFGSQYWAYDSDSGENFHIAAQALSGNPKQKEVNPDFKSVFGKIRAYWIGPYADGRFRTFFPQDDGDGAADGGDLLSGYSFFVKRRGINDYWYLTAGHVILDSTRRSRFIVTVLLKSNQKRYSKMPIKDDDEVKIEVLQDGLRIPIGVNGSNQLVAGTGLDHQKFTFRDLKTRFSLSPGTIQHSSGKEDVSIVTWTKTDSLGSGDSFELVDGIDLKESQTS